MVAAIYVSNCQLNFFSARYNGYMSAAKKQTKTKQNSRDRAAELSVDAMLEASAMLLTAAQDIETLVREMKETGVIKGMKFDGSNRIWAAAAAASGWFHSCYAARDKQMILHKSGLDAASPRTDPLRIQGHD